MKLCGLFSLVLFSSLLVASLLYHNGIGVVKADSSAKLVRQGVLLIRQKAQTKQYSHFYPVTVAKAMNISYAEFIADQDDLTREVLYDEGIGKFSLILVTSEATSQNLDATEMSILDNYEQEFGVAEGLLDAVPSAVMSRYGVSSIGPIVRFNKMRWANGLTNSMDTGMHMITLGANTKVYAYGGNETQTNPVVWSYAHENKIRIASSLSIHEDAAFSYCVVFWLTAKLSPANKILKYYYSVQIADIMSKYSDAGIDGGPSVTDLYLDGSDIEYMVNNFVSPLGINPALAIEYVDVGRLGMPVEYPALYDALKLHEDKFDFTGHWHGFWKTTTTYQMALDVIREERKRFQDWGFEPTLYYMVPGTGNYTNVTAPAITDSPTWYIAQIFSYTSNVVPYINKSGDFDIWSPTLFRVPIVSFLYWGHRSLSQVLTRSGAATWDDYNYNQIMEFFDKPRYLGGYRIEDTHFPNWVYGREHGDGSALTLIKNIVTIGVLPIVPTRTWGLAENLYFIHNYKFNATYNLSENTLTYDIIKVNNNARDRITLVLEGKNRPIDARPLILKYDLKSTILTLKYKPSITIKLDDEEKGIPYIANYQTSILTSSSWNSDIQRLFFILDAPNEAISTTKIYCANLGKPQKVQGNGVDILFNYDKNSKILTVSVTHYNSIEIIVDWTTGLTLACYTVDSKGYGVKTRIELLNQTGFLLAESNTNETGWGTFWELDAGNYTLKVIFQGIQVNSTRVNLTQNIIIIIHSQIYYLTVAVKDQHGKAVHQAEVTVNYSNGTDIKTSRTDENGLVIFPQLPIASYNVTTIYKEHSSSQTISLNKDDTISIQITLPAPLELITPQLLILILVLLLGLILTYITHRHIRTKPALCKGAGPLIFATNMFR